MNALDLLRETAATIEARGTAYGPADRMFALVAARWSQVLGTTVTSSQVVLCLLDLKLARLIHDPRHRDSQIDIAGYAALLQEVSHAPPETARSGHG